MSKRTLEYRTELLKRLANPAEADAYLVAAAEDSTGMHIVALKDVIDSLRSRLAEAEKVIDDFIPIAELAGDPGYIVCDGKWECAECHDRDAEPFNSKEEIAHEKDCYVAGMELLRSYRAKYPKGGGNE